MFSWLRRERTGAQSCWNPNLSYLEMAQLIERFLNGHNAYPQEWNDFVDTAQRDKEMDVYRVRCDELDPLVNRPDPQNPGAVAELRSLAAQLQEKGAAGRVDRRKDEVR